MEKTGFPFCDSEICLCFLFLMMISSLLLSVEFGSGSSSSVTVLNYSRAVGRVMAVALTLVVLHISLAFQLLILTDSW